MNAKNKRRKKIPFPPEPAIEARPLIGAEQASAVMRLFKVFANGTRLLLLHALLRDEELCVSELAQALGMKPQAVSNQQPAAQPAGKALLLRAALGPNGPQVQIDVVDRAEVDTNLFADMAGLRLCVDEADQPFRGDRYQVRVSSFYIDTEEDARKDENTTGSEPSPPTACEESAVKSPVRTDSGVQSCRR